MLSSTSDALSIFINLKERRVVFLAAAAAAGVAVAGFVLRQRKGGGRLRGSELPLLRTEIPGPRSQEIITRLAQHECPAITARRARRAAALGLMTSDPIVWHSAQGSCVRDVDGNIFIDITAGFAVAAAGHSSEAVRQALHEQLEVPLLHAMGDAFTCETRVRLLELLSSFFPPTAGSSHGGLGLGILGCSGSDAIQAALKTAVLATGRQGVLGFSGGYHGLAHGALGCTWYKSDGFRDPFSGQLDGTSPDGGVPLNTSAWRFAEYGALPLPPLREWGVGAVVVEAVQGRGGIRSPPDGWLAALRLHCTQEGALLIVDEIYSGFGRTGDWFAFQGADGGRVDPDMVCVGKAMGGGLPISACLGTRECMEAWGASKGESLHTQTFLGNPMASAAAIAALEELKRLDAPSLARTKGAMFRKHLAEAGFGPDLVRGRGLMLAVEVKNPLAAMGGLLQKGVIGLPCGEGSPPQFAMAVIPPLTITDSQMRFVAMALKDVCL